MGPKKAISKTDVNVQITTNTNEPDNTINTNNTNTPTANDSEPIKAKRGRKSKKELMASLNMTFTKDSVKSQEKTPSIPIYLNVNEIPQQITEDVIDSLSVEPVYDILLTNNSFSETLSTDNQVVTITNTNECLDVNTELNIDGNVKDEQPTSKKRGRKPKGGKIIQQVLSNETQKEDRPNVILHLKCSMKDLQTTNKTASFVESYSFQTNKSDLHNCGVYVSNENMCLNKHSNYIANLDNEHDYDDGDVDSVCKDVHKEINKKLKQLEQNLHINNVSNKKSCCFWDTCEFDNPPIYIPKHFINGRYEVYGCFCSPKCGVAYLMDEHIDSSTKFERYHMFNFIYTKIYDYKKNIKPAPNPYYMLDKFYGNLSIQEYRLLLQNERLFLIVDKPLTRILPELHEDNDDFILNNKIIPSNNYHLKTKLQRKKNTKTSIVNEKFGIVNQEV
jgi:hypothetical protein